MQELEIIPGLIVKNLNGQLTTLEQRTLNEWVNRNERNRRFFEEATNEQALLAELRLFTTAEPDEAAFNRTLLEAVPAATVVGLRRPWRKYVAVAASVLVLSAGAYLITKDRLHHNTAVSPVMAKRAADVPPGHDGAVLTLADGSTVVLDSAATGLLATQGNARVLLHQGRLSYDVKKSATSAEAFYNQVSTPRARKFRITLPDNTQVWLNAASTLRYPAAFTGAERRVELSGEAYFEVAQNAAKPFIIHSTAGPRAADITVLGTHFNIMSYANEDAIKTTLLQGRVSVRPSGLRPTDNGQRPTFLLPGQQSAIGNESTVLNTNIDTDDVIAWKENLLSFHQADIQTIMRQLERWYDIDVQYSGAPPARTFSGKVSSAQPLSDVLKILEVNDIHFALDGRVLTVKP